MHRMKISTPLNANAFLRDEMNLGGTERLNANLDPTKYQARLITAALVHCGWHLANAECKASLTGFEEKDIGFPSGIIR